MAPKVRVVSYLNQFFGQVGGEEEAGASPFLKKGPIGPGQILKDLLGEQCEVVATIVCGDNYFSDRMEEAKTAILDFMLPLKPHLILAGPAFNAGRYGIACGEVCKLAKEKLGIEAVTGMHQENPGVEMYRGEVYILETGPSVLHMAESMAKMARFGLKLVSKGPVGGPQEEGFFPRGVKRNTISPDLASDRAIRALLSKIRGEPFHTEIRKPPSFQVPPAPPLENLSQATIALVTEGGLVPNGNPDNIENHRATRYGRYSLEGLHRLSEKEYHSIHRGYDTGFVNEDPNRLVPVDVMRDMEQEGTFARLHPFFYTTTGVATFLENAREMGRAIARELKASGVSGVILTSTWGTGTRCGAVLEQEIERAEIPCTLITAMVPAAQSIGANRIIRGHAIVYPLGDPNLSPEKEKMFRRKIVSEALQVLARKIDTGSDLGA